MKIGRFIKSISDLPEASYILTALTTLCSVVPSTKAVNDFVHADARTLTLTLTKTIILGSRVSKIFRAVHRNGEQIVDSGEAEAG